MTFLLKKHQYNSLLTAFIIIGGGLLSWLAYEDKVHQATENGRTVNFVLSVAPKLMIEGDLIKLHSLINGQGALETCILGTDKQVLVRTTGSQCNFTQMETYPLLYASRPVGTLILQAGFGLLNRIQVYLLFSITWIGIIFLVHIFRAKTVQLRSVEYLKQLLNNNGPGFAENEPNFFARELLPLLEAVKLKNDNIRRKIQINIANQVAHDIRSPLSALEMLSSSLTNISDDKKEILRNTIKRIRDIANSLSLNESNVRISDADTPFATSQLNQSNEYLVSIIESIVAESQAKYSNLNSIEISYFISQTSYNAFARVNDVEMTRVVSNLINNAVEALPPRGGNVTVSLQSNETEHTIEVKDNGVGIPKEIITKLGNRGATFNKVGGNGLGLFHAKTIIECWGGTFQVSSKVGFGTTIAITLPKSASAEWFQRDIELNATTTLIIVDDDSLMHDLWDRRFEKVQNRPTIIHLHSARALKEFLRTRFLEIEHTLFLVDQQYSGENDTGLSLIQSLGLAKECILVTSRYGSPDIQEAAIAMSIKIIPKIVAHDVPITASLK